MYVYMAFKIVFDSAFPVKGWLGFQAIFEEKKIFSKGVFLRYFSITFSQIFS